MLKIAELLDKKTKKSSMANHAAFDSLNITPVLSFNLLGP